MPRSDVYWKGCVLCSLRSSRSVGVEECELPGQELVGLAGEVQLRLVGANGVQDGLVGWEEKQKERRRRERGVARELDAGGALGAIDEELEVSGLERGRLLTAAVLEMQEDGGLPGGAEALAAEEVYFAEGEGVGIRGGGLGCRLKLPGGFAILRLSRHGLLGAQRERTCECDGDGEFGEEVPEGHGMAGLNYSGCAWEQGGVFCGAGGWTPRGVLARDQAHGR
jgi:hypothetical protein